MRLSLQTKADAKRLMPGVTWNAGPHSAWKTLISDKWLITELRGGDVTLEYRPDGTSFTGPDLEAALRATREDALSKLAVLDAAAVTP